MGNNKRDTHKQKSFRGRPFTPSELKGWDQIETCKSLVLWFKQI